MKKSLTVILASLLFSGTILTAHTSGIATSRVERNMVSEYAGEKCSTPKKGSGVVGGLFRGWQQTPFGGRGSGMRPVERYRCFKTTNECQGWLATMTYLYSDKGNDAAICKKF